MLRRTGSEFRINTHTEGWQDQPDLVALKRGGFAAVWQSGDQDGSSTGIYLQLFNAKGKAIGPERLVNQTTEGAQRSPEVAELANGGLVVTWSGPNHTPFDMGIYMRRLNSDGRPKGPEVLLEDASPGAETNPAITAFADGDYMVTWRSGGLDGVGRGVIGQRFTPGGVARDISFQINSSDAESPFFAKIAELPEGGFWAIWQTFGQDGDQGGIYAQRFGANNSPKGPSGPDRDNIR